MKHSMTIIAALLIAVAAQAQTVWERPAVEENTQTEGYFRSLLEITKVEFDEKDTRVYMHLERRPDSWLRFATDTYLLADGKRYAVKSCDGLELGKETFLTNRGKADVVFHFEPLPLTTTKFDFIEGDGQDPFRLMGVENADTRAKRLFPSAWRNMATGDWEIAFYEECVIYDCRFWNYKERKQKGDKYEFVLENDGEEIAVKVGKSKKAHRCITIDGKKRDYDIISTITLPDYPQTDERKGFKDNGYQEGDSVTLVGWLRGMPQWMEAIGDEYEISLYNIFTGEEENCIATLDSLGRFVAKIPLLNSAEFYFDWNRTYVRTMFEPGETYLMLYDMKEGHKLFMGDDARLQNEIFAYPIEWSGFYIHDETTSEEVIRTYLPAHEERLKVLERIVEEHPTLSARYREYLRGHYNCGFGYSLMQARFSIKGRNVSKEHMGLAEKLFNNIPAPYTLYRDFNTFKRDYIDQHIDDRFSYKIPTEVGTVTIRSPYPLMPAILRHHRATGSLEISDEDIELVEKYAKINDEYLRKIATTTDKVEIDRLNKAFEENEVVMRAGQLFKREDIAEIQQMEVPLYPVYRALTIADTLGCDKTLRDMLITYYLYKHLDNQREPLGDHAMQFMEENVQMPAAKAFLKRENDKYLAILNKELRYANSLRSSDDIAGMNDGESILRKLLEPMKGKVVIIDVWGTWCGPCKRALSHSQEEYARLANYDVAYLYLANGSSKESWENVIKQYEVTGENVYHYNLPDEQQSKVENFLKVSGYPTYRIVDKEGNILDVNADPRDLDALERVVRQLNEE
ncbi:MAG: TlpA family protein disulfide reductase [Bacteroidaceae bacterium]|nr:TlpA family protein disulfide reductase [Bacteroidaceae bacterium]